MKTVLFDLQRAIVLTLHVRYVFSSYDLYCEWQRNDNKIAGKTLSHMFPFDGIFTSAKKLSGKCLQHQSLHHSLTFSIHHDRQYL